MTDTEMTKTIKLVILLGLVGFLIYMFVKNNNNENFKAVEGFEEGDEEQEANPEQEEVGAPVNQDLNAEELLPKEVDKDWFQSKDIEINKDNLDDLVDVNKYSVGINTVGQSLKNASHDLRAAPPNPKNVVSPWMQSSIEPDYNIKNIMDC